MGQDEDQTEYTETKIEKISRNFFDFQYIIGKGGFGKVNKEYNIIYIFN